MRAYTDGSFQSSINAGGFSCILVDDSGKETILFKGLKGTTNNRCELLGVITALECTNEEEVLDIYSDSQYVINNIKFVKS